MVKTSEQEGQTALKIAAAARMSLFYSPEM